MNLEIGQRIRVFEVHHGGGGYPTENGLPLFKEKGWYAEHHESEWYDNKYGADLISEYSHPLMALHVNCRYAKQVGTLIIKKIK